ncbi:MAG: transposase [bacterium]|nr:transposase [bacterium]
MKDVKAYNAAVSRLRAFFVSRGYLEVPAQPRLSILAACEDPDTISLFQFSGEIYPLPQTGQMQLEAELLNNADWPGVYCISTSYRNEPNPIPGRHDLTFPMFEFESHGNIEDLIKMEAELLSFLDFPLPKELEYENVCSTYETDDVGIEEEDALLRDYGVTVVLRDFPFRSHPFWNMLELDNGLFAKVDVIVQGMETIGSAERSCDPNEMLHNFHSVSDGMYAKKLFDLFGKERVTAELDEYLSLDMFPRFGGGIGLTRLARAMKMSKIADFHLEQRPVLAQYA